MDTRCIEAERGLRLLFWGEILFLVAAVCVLVNVWVSFFPIAVKVLAGLSFVVSLFGLVTAVRAYEGYQSALFFLVICIILWVSVNWVEDRWYSAFLNAACVVVNYLMVARVCAASADLLFQDRDASGAQWTARVRLAYRICAAVSVACFLAGSAVRLGVLAEIVRFMGMVVSLVAGLIYLLFLQGIHELIQN